MAMQLGSLPMTPFMPLLSLMGIVKTADSAPGDNIAQPAPVPSEPSSDLEKVSAFALPELPYAMNALEPHISDWTMSFHYSKHHQAYVNALNIMLAGRSLGEQPLEQIIWETAGKADEVTIFNNAAQAWNHAFFWRSITPGGGGQPSGRLLQLIERSFGIYEEFKGIFVSAALAQFGSGWVWLVQHGDRLQVVTTANADTPLLKGQIPLCVCDLWEHAYYLDYQHRRKDFVQAFLDHLVNWDFAASQLR